MGNELSDPNILVDIEMFEILFNLLECVVLLSLYSTFLDRLRMEWRDVVW